MNEATKYNRAKTWQIALFALNMMSTNMYLFLMMYVSYYANGILGMSVVFVSFQWTFWKIPPIPCCRQCASCIKHDLII